MSQLLLFFLIFVVVYYVWTNYPSNDIGILSEGFRSSEIIGTPLSEANTLIFTPNFQGSDRRQQPLVDSPEKFGYLWSPYEELFRKKLGKNGGLRGGLPPFTPGKLHSVTFADDTSQIAGPIHPAPCPPIGTGPGFKGPNLSDFERVSTGHENGNRRSMSYTTGGPAEVLNPTQNLCVCEDS